MQGFKSVLDHLDEGQLTYLQGLSDDQIKDALSDMGMDIPPAMVPQLIQNARGMIHLSASTASKRADSSPREYGATASTGADDFPQLLELRSLLKDPAKYTQLSADERHEVRENVWHAWDSGVLAKVMKLEKDREQLRALVARVRRLPDRTQDALSIKAFALMASHGIEPWKFVDAGGAVGGDGGAAGGGTAKLERDALRPVLAFCAELELALLYHGFLAHGGPRSLRVVTFVVAFYTFWVAAVGVFVDDAIGQPYAGLTLFYCELFCVVAMLVESDALCGVAARAALRARAGALQAPSGRAAFYVFTGTLALGSWTAADALVLAGGFALIACGLAYAAVAVTASRKLQALRPKGAGGGAADEAHCRELFGVYDADGDGALDAKEFGALCASEMSGRGGLAQYEVEAALLMLNGSSGDHSIKYDEFADWYLRRGAHAVFESPVIGGAVAGAEPASSYDGLV